MNYREFTANELMEHLSKIPTEIRCFMKITIVSNEDSKLDETIEPVINNNELQTYLDYIYSNAIDEVSPGYMKISKNTGLSIEVCRKIKGHLENLGVVKSDGLRTFILKQNWTA